MAGPWPYRVTLRCRKAYSCVGCGAAFSYQLVRLVEGEADAPEEVRARAEADVHAAAARDVEEHPCPSCGRYQPDMVGQALARWHGWTSWGAALAFAVLLGLTLARFLQPNVATLAMAACCALVTVVHATVAWRGMDGDLERNRRRGQALVTLGVLTCGTDRSRTAPRPRTRPPRSPLRVIAAALLLVAVLAAVAPELLRRAEGWPLNASAYGPVVGPGDEARVYMEERFQSILGYWRGRPQVVLRELRAGAPARWVPARCPQRDWGAAFASGDVGENVHVLPWVEFTVPDDPGLAGSIVSCCLKLDAEYPVTTGPHLFTPVERALSRTLLLALAAPGAGRRYQWFWCLGLALAAATALAAGALLGRAARAEGRAAPAAHVTGLEFSHVRTGEAHGRT